MSDRGDLGDHVRRALEECDIPTMRKIHAHAAPHLPPLGSDFEVLASIHRARTEAPVFRMRLRAWSHRWLLDHDLPSALPDKLRPRAERMYPQLVTAVGIAVNSTSSLLQPLAKELERAMSEAVLDAYANHRTEPDFVRARMADARARVLKAD